VLELQEEENTVQQTLEYSGRTSKTATGPAPKFGKCNLLLIFRGKIISKTTVIAGVPLLIFQSGDFTFHKIL
jgi:hypothetical protein